jgi:hypothetical protein
MATRGLTHDRVVTSELRVLPELTVLTASYKIAFWVKILFMLAGFLTSCSLLALYYRLIQEANIRWFRIALHISTVFNIVSWLPFMFAEIFTCV